jgi:hypothetical protein
VLYEPAANTNIEIQALGRVRRPGQKKPQVVYRLFVEDTFNGYQEMKQLEKRMGEMAGWGGKDPACPHSFPQNNGHAGISSSATPGSDSGLARKHDIEHAYY